MKHRFGKELTKGFIKENPVLRLCLGTCPTLAVTTSVLGGIGMGLAATAVLIGSNIVISLLRKVIPAKIRIPAYITVIAGFVTVVQMLVQAFLPTINDLLGLYLPLIVVNCIILGRAEAFASKNPVLLSAVDGLGMGLGFTLALVVMGSIREILGAGTFLGYPILDQPMLIFIMAPGGFFVFGLMIAAANAIAKRLGKKPVTSAGCEGCPGKDACTGCGGCSGEEELPAPEPEEQPVPEPEEEAEAEPEEPAEEPTEAPAEESAEESTEEPDEEPKEEEAAQ